MAAAQVCSTPSAISATLQACERNRLSERVALRVFQIEYNPVFLRERSINVLGGVGALEPTRLESNRQDNIRLGFGVVF